MDNAPQDTLIRFYREFQEWVEAEFPGSIPFAADYGLCANLAFWLEDNNCGDQFCIGVPKAQSQSYIDAGLDEAYPFNDADNPYNLECDKYTNPARLAWIKEWAAKELSDGN